MNKQKTPKKQKTKFMSLPYQICLHTVCGYVVDPVNIKFTSRGRSLLICLIYFHR